MVDWYSRLPVPVRSPWGLPRLVTAPLVACAERDVEVEIWSGALERPGSEGSEGAGNGAGAGTASTGQVPARGAGPEVT